MNNVKNTLKSAHNRSSIAILITAAALMLLISAIQQYSARKQIRNDLERSAEMELFIKSIAVKHSLEKCGTCAEKPQLGIRAVSPLS